MTPKEKQILSVVAAVAILAGGLVWAAKSRQTPPPSPSPQGGGKETADETADWKTYRNEELGFEVKYPGTMTTEEYNSKRNVVIRPVGYEVYGIFPEIKVFENRSASIHLPAILNTINQDSAYKKMNFKQTGIADYSLGGQSGKRVAFTSDSGTVFTYIVVESETNLFEFFVPETLESNSTYSRMISTFKFTK